MKTIAATLVAFALVSGTTAAMARPIDNYFTELNQSAPRSVFDDIRDSAPRTIFDDIQDSAPRTIFDDIQDSAPRSGGKGDSPVDLNGE
jgi:hypothetical protein